MGGANRKHRPHRGSMQFWPRKRAKKAYSRIRSWLKQSPETKLLGFPGYKVGMTHLIIEEKDPTSPAGKMHDVSIPATILECPPLKVLSVRYYRKTPYGLKVVKDIYNKKADKEILRKVKLPKSNDDKVPESFDDVRLIVYTQPKLTGIGKKKPEILELGIGGKDASEKSNLALSMLEKDVRVSDVFKEGQIVDVHSVTKGKGFQGTVKRFGVKIRQSKSEKTKRGIGNLGSWTPKRVQYTVAQPGRMGFHLRTENNKRTLKIGSDPKEINQKGGFLHYGLIKNDYILIKGSVPGSVKRLVTLTEPSRKSVKAKEGPVTIKYISIESKQGC